MADQDKPALAGEPAVSEGAAPAAASSDTAGTPQAPPDPVVALRAEIQAELTRQRTDTETALRTIIGLIQQQAAAPEVAPEPDVQRAKVREALDADPEAAIDAIVSRRIGPILREQAERTGTLAREEAHRRLLAADYSEEEWRAHHQALDEFMVGVPADQKLNPDTWANAFQIVLLQAGKLGQAELARERRRIEREQGMSAEGSGRMVRPTGPAPLTDLEKRHAKAAGMTEEEYRLHRDALFGGGN